MKKDDLIYHYNEENYQNYIVNDVMYVVDDCGGQFYQRVLLLSA
jgi:hypothetical protein